MLRLLMLDGLLVKDVCGKRENLEFGLVCFFLY